jgi:hypothetical protein
MVNVPTSSEAKLKNIFESFCNEPLYLFLRLILPVLTLVLAFKLLSKIYQNHHHQPANKEEFSATIRIFNWYMFLYYFVFWIIQLIINSVFQFRADQIIESRYSNDFGLDSLSDTFIRTQLYNVGLLSFYNIRVFTLLIFTLLLFQIYYSFPESFNDLKFKKTIIFQIITFLTISNDSLFSLCCFINFFLMCNVYLKFRKFSKPIPEVE